MAEGYFLWATTLLAAQLGLPKNVRLKSIALESDGNVARIVVEGDNIPKGRFEPMITLHTVLEEDQKPVLQEAVAQWPGETELRRFPISLGVSRDLSYLDADMPAAKDQR